jgi:hypothetical protein
MGSFARMFLRYAMSAKSALSQCMDNHWPSNRCSRSNQQRRKALLNPGQCSPIGLFGTRKILEDTDRSHGVVGCIDYIIIGHKAIDITDDRNCPFLDSARQLFGQFRLLPCLDGSKRTRKPPFRGRYVALSS